MSDENSESLREIVDKSQEKIRILLKRTKELEEKNTRLETLLKIIENKNIDRLFEKIHDIEIRTQALEIIQTGRSENKKQVVNFILQLIWVVLAAYILLKLGLQGPPV